MADHRRPLADLEQASPFAERHIGPRPEDEAKMLAALGYATLDDLLADAVPGDIRSAGPLALPAGRTEAEVLDELRAAGGRRPEAGAATLVALVRGLELELLNHAPLTAAQLRGRVGPVVEALISPRSSSS